PLLLVLEDAHDADPPSLELAAYVARRAAHLRVMLLITRRELPASATADRLEHALRSRGLLVSELSLPPLPAAAVATLARSAARLADADVTRVIERADGNPLLAVETARALANGGGPEVPPSLRVSVRGTLAPLTPDARGFVDIAAVAARPIEADELDQLGLLEPASQA